MILTAEANRKKPVVPAGKTEKKDDGAQLLPGLSARRDWFAWTECCWKDTGALLAEADGAGFDAVEWRINWNQQQTKLVIRNITAERLERIYL